VPILLKSRVTTLVSFSTLALGAFGKLVITTAVSNVSRNLGYWGFGSRGVSEKYPSSAADSSSRFGSLIIISVFCILYCGTDKIEIRLRLLSFKVVEHLFIVGI